MKQGAGFSRLQRVGGLVLLLFGALPLAAVTESLLRTSAGVLFFRDYVLGALAFVLLLPFAPFIQWPMVSTGAVVLLACGAVALRQKKKGQLKWTPYLHFLRKTFVTIVLISLTLAGVALWLFFCCWQPHWGAATGLLVLVVALGLRRAKEARILYALLSLAAAGPVLLFGANVLSFSQALPIAQQRLYNDAAFDAAGCKDRLVVLSAHKRKAVVLENRKDERVITQTQGPQRLAVDPQSCDAYIANYWNRDNGQVVLVEGDKVVQLSLPGCVGPLDIALDENRSFLLAACEGSCSVHRFDLDTRQTGAVWDVSCYPYGLALAHRRARAYVSSEVLFPKVTAIDTSGNAVLGTRWVGIVNWGIAVDQGSGRVFVTRPLSGEVAVLDESLNPIARIPTGFGTRDLAVDPDRDLLLAGNYVTGTLSLIDLKSLTLVQTVRVGRSGISRKLRGVAVDVDGAWIATDDSGVWRIVPEPALFDNR